MFFQVQQARGKTYCRKSPSVGLIIMEDLLLLGLVKGKGIWNGGSKSWPVARGTKQMGHFSGVWKQNTLVWGSQCLKQNIFGSFMVHGYPKTSAPVQYSGERESETKPGRRKAVSGSRNQPRTCEQNKNRSKIIKIKMQCPLEAGVKTRHFNLRG